MHLPLLVRSLKQKVCLVELVQVSYIDQPCHCCRILKSQPFRKAWFSNVGVVLNFIKKKSCRPEFPFPFEDQLTFLSSPSDATVNKSKKGKNNTTERFSVKEENAMICFPQKKKENVMILAVTCKSLPGLLSCKYRAKISCESRI
jgi:hypothetical protein